METHNIKAHPKEKHFKHYLFEFFMLFFAVALGFFVENMREKNTENQRGIAYLRSLFQDVNTDTGKLTMVIMNFEEKIRGLDTLIRHFSDISSQKYPSMWMRNHGALSYYADFIYTDKTILQLKNSGGLRLINDPETADSIMNYDGSIKQLAIQETSVSSQENIVEKLDAEVIDHRKMNAISDSADLENVTNETGWTLDNDKKLLGSFYNEIFFYKGICNLYLRYLVNAKATAVRFIKFLDNKYHFS